MITKKILLPVAIALACGAGSANAFLVDFDGNGVGAQQVTGIDPGVGNLISRCAAGVANLFGGTNCTTTALGVPPAAGGATVGSYLETFGHAALDSGDFTNALGDPVNFGVGGEWTLVFGFTEVIIAAAPGGATFATVGGDFAAPGGTANFFELYYQAAPNSVMLAGTGFNDGTLILAGTIDGFEALIDPAAGRGDFTVTNLGALLDNFGGDNYAGKTTVSTNGNVQLNLTPTFRDASFFIDPITGLSLSASSQINLPFTQTNPSGCFAQTPGGGAPSLGGAGASDLTAGCGDTIGATNGITGPNTMFQSDANISLQNAVPEPTTLALLGGALLAVGAARRSRKNNG